MDMTTCVYLISQAIHRDHDVPHIFEDYSLQKPYDYVKNSGSIPLGMAGAGIYKAVYIPLLDGQMGMFRMTADGKLMTDASISIGSLTVNVTPTVWTNRFYAEVQVTNAGTLNVPFGFVANEITIANDDDVESVWLAYGAAAVADANHDKVLSGEKFKDPVPSASVDLITDVAGPVTVRVWARAL